MGALIPKLVERGILNGDDAREVCETVLLMIEARARSRKRTSERIKPSTFPICGT